MKRILTVVILSLVCMLSVQAQELLGHSILFKKDSVNVDESQMAHLELIANYLKAHPKEMYFIGGFVSSETDSSRVDAICELRAQNTRKVLTEKFGVDCTYVIAIGVGVSNKADMPEFNEKVEFFKK